MNEFVKIGLIGVGGYILYEYLFGTPAQAVVGNAPSTSIAPTGVITTNVPVAPSVNLSAGTLPGGQVAAKANAGAAMTVSQWNYYQNLDRPGGNIILGGPNIPSGNVIYADWQAAFNSAGAIVGPQPSGVSGLGYILNLSDLPTPSEIGWGVGDDEFEYGLGNLLNGARVGSLGFRGLGGIVDAPENNAAYIDQGVFLEAAATDGGLDSSSQDFYLAAGLPIK
jgi:hypothetical protein